MVVQDNLSPEEGNRAPSKHEKKHRLKQRFEVVKKLGQGTYGKVQLAVNKESNQEVAIKTIKKSKIECEQDLIRIRREIQIMSSIQHPHIIHIYEVFENKEKIVLVMQYASGGELYDYLSQKKILNDVEARRIFRQIAAAVYYCHKNKICHRDLKLENVLLDEKGNAKIADFGLSNVYDEKHLLDTFCGSPLYASPEIVKGVPYYGPEVDCWSLGVILYTLVYGAMPFDGSNFKRLVKQISEGDYYEPTKKAEASHLIHRLLHINPGKRATIIDICTDWWVNEGYEHSLLQVAEDLANLTPVRIDLLLALAPASPTPQEGNTEHPVAFSNDDNKPCPKVPEEDSHVNDDDTETVTDSFTFLDGKSESHRSTSFPNVPNLDETEDDEFLPAALAAELEGQCTKRQAEQSFDGSLMKISSIAHKTKKPRKSSSTDTTQSKENKTTCETSKDQNNNDNTTETVNEIPPTKKESTTQSNAEVKRNNIDAAKENDKSKELSKQNNMQQTKDNDKKILEQENKNKSVTKRRQSEEINKSDIEKVSTPGGRKPGKIAIPKFLESPETSPTKNIEKKPLSQVVNVTETQSDLKPEDKNIDKHKSSKQKTKDTTNDEKVKQSEEMHDTKSKNTDTNEKSSEINEEGNEQHFETKKVAAKGILKKNIAKARLLEKRLSQQSSVESEGGSASPPANQSNTSPTLGGESPDVSKGPSFFKVPQPYSKNVQEKPIESKAEIIFSSNQDSLLPKDKKASKHKETESIWGTPLSSRNDKNNQIVEKHVEWNNSSSDIQSNTDDWKQQVEESLIRLSPQEEDFNCAKSLGPTPITRSYKKFTFTKEGTCITETGKIYTKPGADGSWTKVEKKTKITTLPGNDEFQKFEHVQVRDEASLSRSDSQSSSGSVDVFDDIFDSWTGDSMMCNFLKVKDNIRRFTKGPLLWRERHRDPFKHFSKPEKKTKEWPKHTEKKMGILPNQLESDDEEFDIHFDDTHPVAYGSQGLWQLMMSVNKDLPHYLQNLRDSSQIPSFSRSISRDRGAGLIQKQNQYGSRASSGYSTRSLSRERSQSPRERILRFVLESPQRQQSLNASEMTSPISQELWNSKGINSNVQEGRCRKDSGVESCTSAESEIIRQPTSRLSSREDEISYVPLDSPFGPKTYHQYVKSFSKDTSSDRQGSFEEQYPQSPFDNLPDSKRHRVEQWLHMTDVDDFDSPFEEFARHHELLSRCESPKTSIYGTMRPRSFMKYNRSVSDKLTDPDIFATNLQETQHSQSNQSLEGQSNKSYRSEISVDSTGRVQSSIFKTVSNANNEQTAPSQSGGLFHLQQSDSEGNAKKQYISSSQNNSQNSTKYTRSFSGNLQFSDTQENRIPSRGQNRPILSMTVSFNRGSTEGPIIVHSNSARQANNTGGIWQQQEFSTSTAPGRVTIRREFSDPISESVHINTIPAQRYYTTQETNRNTVDGFNQARGKNEHSLIHFRDNPNTACSEWCMTETNNLLKHSSHKFESNNNTSLIWLNETKTLETVEENTTDASDGTLTPDSLETSSLKDDTEIKHAEHIENTQLKNMGIWQIAENKPTMIEMKQKDKLLRTEKNEVAIKLHNLTQSVKDENCSNKLSLRSTIDDISSQCKTEFIKQLDEKYSYTYTNECRNNENGDKFSMSQQFPNEESMLKSLEWSKFDHETQYMLTLMNKLKQ